MHTAEVIYELIVIGFSIDRNLSVWIFQNYQNVIKLTLVVFFLYECPSKTHFNK